MAETLTFEDTTEQTSLENLNTDEQDSLKVGEAMQEEQENLLAGKYKDAKDLETAYIELQKKLGSNETSAEETETESKEEVKEEESSEPNLLDTIWEESQNDKYSDETLAKLKEIDSTELANMYLEYRKQNNEPEPTDFTPQDVQELKAIAGGDKGYNDMLQWATDNLNKQEIDMFDAVMEKRDPLSAFFAIRSLAYRYNDAKGYEGKMLTGTAPKTSTEVFRSQAEVVKAMSDPRYDNDPAYRADVMKKLQQSDINF